MTNIKRLLITNVKFEDCLNQEIFVPAIDDIRAELEEHDVSDLSHLTELELIKLYIQSSIVMSRDLNYTVLATDTDLPLTTNNEFQWSAALSELTYDYSTNVIGRVKYDSFVDTDYVIEIDVDEIDPIYDGSLSQAIWSELILQLRFNTIVYKIMC